MSCLAVQLWPSAGRSACMVMHRFLKVDALTAAWSITRAGGQRKSAGELFSLHIMGPGSAPRRIHDARSCRIEKS